MTRHTPIFRSALRVTLGVIVVLCVPLVATLVTDDVVWTTSDFVLAGVFLATIGIVIEMALRRAGNPIATVGIAVLGVIAAIAGEADDAPGLVLLGLLLVGAACAAAIRRRRRGTEFDSSVP